MEGTSECQGTTVVEAGEVKVDLTATEEVDVIVTAVAEEATEETGEEMVEAEAEAVVDTSREVDPREGVMGGDAGIEMSGKIFLYTNVNIYMQFLTDIGT